MAHQYFNELLTVEAFQAHETVTFTGEEARHAVKVSRLRVGEIIRVANGFGSWGTGVVLRATENEVSVELTEANHDAEPQPVLVLVQALAKAGRDEQAVEQATEYGASEIIPWQAERSIVRWEEQKKLKNEAKWAKIAREAAKQSLRTHIPKTHHLHSTKELAKLAAAEGAMVLVLDPQSKKRLSQQLHEEASSGSKILSIYFIVGPEGGITEREQNLLEEAGAKRVSLGKNVLRSGSAGPAAIAVANTVLNRW